MGRGTIKIKKDNFFRTTSIAGILFYSIFFLIPVIFVLGFSSFKNLISCLKESYYIHLISFSLSQALLSSILSVIVGLPGAYILSHKRFKFKRTVKKIYYMPFFLPSILVILGFVIFYGNNGFLNTILGTKIKFLYSFKAILMAHVFYNFPIVALLVSNSWQTIDNEVIEASFIDGSTSINSFVKIELPYLLPSIASAFCLVFLYCFTSFAIILVLGGGPSLSTLEVEIYRQAKISLNFETASSLSLISLAVCSFVLFLNSKFEKNTVKSENSTDTVPAKKPNLPDYLYLIITTVFIAAPILSIIVRSLIGFETRGGNASLSLSAYKNLIKYFPSIANTLLIGFCSAITGTFLAYTLCIFICRGRRSEAIKNIVAMLPMATSSVIIGLGYIFVSRYLSFIPSYLSIILAHSVIVMPFALKTIMPNYKAISDSVNDASRLDGCSEKDIAFNIEIPILKDSFVTSFVFCFALSCGELNSTIVLGNGSQTTVPVLIYRLIASYDYQGACALGCILIIVCFFVISNKFRKN